MPLSTTSTASVPFLYICFVCTTFCLKHIAFCLKHVCRDTNISVKDNDGVISTEELQGCLTALGHIVESNDPAKVDLKTLLKKQC